jgi:hypothetical protein
MVEGGDEMRKQRRVSGILRRGENNRWSGFNSFHASVYVRK